MKQIEDENFRLPRVTMFAIERKTYHPTADLRDRIVMEKESLYAERARLVKAGQGVRP